MAAKKKSTDPVAEEPAPEPEIAEESVQDDPPHEVPPAEDPPPLDNPVTVQVSAESAAPQLSPTESGYNRLGQWVGRKVTRKGR